MSLAMARTMAYSKYTCLSKYHPDNYAPRQLDPLPKPVAGPAPILSFTHAEKKIDGAWGHRLSMEAPFGVGETTTRIKGGVANKVGGSWDKTKMTERGTSVSCSAFYGGSQVAMSCCQAANMVGAAQRAPFLRRVLRVSHPTCLPCAVLLCVSTTTRCLVRAPPVRVCCLDFLAGCCSPPRAQGVGSLKIQP